MATSDEKDDVKATAGDEVVSTAGDEGDEAKAAPKPAAVKVAPAKKPGATGAKGVKRVPPPRGGSSLGKSMLLFVVIVGGLGAAFALLGQETPQPSNAPKWAPGQQVDVEVTLVASDQKDLSCAAPEEINGRHCAFEAQNKPWSKGDNNDDKKLLKPYTTVDRVQFLAAGLWSDPGMAANKLPGTRFSVKCKYTVEGKVKNSAVRWNETGQWYPRNDELYTGSLSGCKLMQ